MPRGLRQPSRGALCVLPPATMQGPQPLSPLPGLARPDAVRVEEYSAIRADYEACTGQGGAQSSPAVA